VNIEQTLVANGLGAAIVQPGLLGPESDDLFEGGMMLVQEAERLGKPVSDYVLSSKNSHGVFLMATHDPRHAEALLNYKLGPGPYYMLKKPDLTAYLEIMKTVKRVLRGQELFLDNSAHPTVSVAAITKRPVRAGTHIPSAIGSFDFRGIAVEFVTHAGHAPIGLMRNVVVRRDLDAGEVVMLSDLDLQDSGALQAWSAIEARALGSGAPAAS
jgi:predicted homoserine dehydrogenase-like protein